MSKKIKPITYTVLILDQSGSMRDRRQYAVQMYNEQVQQAKLNSKDNDIRMCLLTFNGDVFEHLWDVPATDLQESTDADYECGGSTALNDAIGYAIEKLLATTDSNKEDTTYLVQIITDGEENASSHFKREMVLKNGIMQYENPLKALIERVQETKRWTFAFMGCSQNYLEQLSKETAIPTSNMAAYSLAAMGTAPLMAAGSANVYYRNKSGGQSVHANYMNRTGDSVADIQMEEKTAAGILRAAMTPEQVQAKAAMDAAPKTSSTFSNPQAANWGVVNTTTTNS